MPEGVRIDQDEEGIQWTINTPAVRLVLNTRRGLAITSLAFRSHDYEPVVCTLPQGYFSSIELGADFYSGGVLIEIPGERMRMTDLEWATPIVQRQGHRLLISAVISLPQGNLRKTITLDTKTEKLTLTYGFEKFERPMGIVRVGVLTLLPQSFLMPISVRCVNGGPAAETFRLDEDVSHGDAASTLVSSTAAFGATDGRIEIEDAGGRRLVLSWNPADCAAVPMLKHQRSQDLHLTRISFSLCELDDTSRKGGRLIQFSVTLGTGCP